MSAVLVTGCSVFLGDAIVRALAARGHTVTASARGARDGVSALDVLDVDRVRTAVAQVDTVVHLATVRAYGDNTERAREVTVDGTVNVVRAARAIGARVVLAGTAEEYGPSVSVPYREDGPYAPSSPYGLAKREAMSLALSEYADGVTVLRPSTVYGPRQPSMMLVASCARAAVNDGVLSVSGGAQLRDLVYVDDAADAFARAVDAHDRVRGVSVNIASGIERSVAEIAEQIAKIAGRGRVELGPPSRRAGDVEHMAFETERAAERLGWRASTTLSDGLARTVAWARLSR